MKSYLPTLLISILLASCSQNSSNAKTEFGKESGLPSNCRAYVQSSIDGYRAHNYSAEETMAGLERNCGENGTLWETQ
jgi:hypothetical protein